MATQKDARTTALAALEEIRFLVEEVYGSLTSGGEIDFDETGSLAMSLDSEASRVESAIEEMRREHLAKVRAPRQERNDD